MKFKLGDFVRFVDEKREGYVTSIIDEQTLGVTDTDGFEIPVSIGNLTSIHGHMQDSPAEEEAAAAAAAPKKVAVKPPAEQGIFLVLQPGSKQHAIRFHLVNHNANRVLFSLMGERQGKFSGIQSGILEPGNSAPVFEGALPDLDLWPEFHLALLQHGASELLQPIRFNRKFRPKDFAPERASTALQGEKGWQFRLGEPPLKIDAQQLKESFFKPTPQKQGLARPETETDLHIEKLRSDHQFLRGDEILDIQLGHFRKTLEAALVHKLPELILIHGAGNGILQQQIHRELGKHPQVRTFMDAQKEKFGYGATKVVFK
ncbi:DNA mismatch repair protein MutS [Pedobacter yulinensis]|uniref:DNA mismatch repair protein MutS n=1 Tax=Pedobacter yulinensis TaxID=2126353 RepID=A0A2T3HQQ5_9SPHI|nr:Smr/MutS family protein [Pedobacter yulinensis]PST84778.1 DNA mismatch repair protein MutS [Pedobacter yulinensis]